MAPDPMDPKEMSTQVSLARIDERLKFLQRDISDIKSLGAESSRTVDAKVNELIAWRERTEGALKVLARAQSILYAAFAGGFLLGIFDAYHALTGK